MRQFGQMIAQFMTGGNPCGAEEAPQNEEAEWTAPFGEKRSKWSEYRAMIVKKPDAPVPARIGQVVFLPIEILNQTKWPWKPGCILTTSPKQSAVLQGLAFNNVTIDCDVKGL
jgi:hypothetical protein